MFAGGNLLGLRRGPGNGLAYPDPGVVSCSGVTIPGQHSVATALRTEFLGRSLAVVAGMALLFTTPAAFVPVVDGCSFRRRSRKLNGRSNSLLLANDILVLRGPGIEVVKRADIVAADIEFISR